MKKIFSFLLIFLIMSCVCYDYVRVITFKNNSNSKIYVYKTCKDSVLKSPRIFAFDTSYFNIKDIKKFDTVKYNVNIIKKRVLYDNSIFPDSTKMFTDFERGRYRYNCQNNQINFFIINYTILNSKKWDTIVKYQLYEKKLTYTFKEVKDLNWLIEYE